MEKGIKNIESPALGCLLGTAYQTLLGKLGKALKDASLDINTSDYLVLRAIYSKEGLQQCEIAEMIGKDKAAVCRCVSGLEKKGLVKTVSISHKCLKVFPSQRGLEIKERILGVAQLRHDALLDLTTKEELATFIRVLEKIIESDS
ncbi:MAG: MarR family transcriptional regulator [Muribaculaceae bacterium]|nr:MarR family transcriptional regulator [Muribaculaceae bacterium]